jgi:hypothetical protein
MKRELIKAVCGSCGKDFGVYYDARNDYYICRGCLEKEQEEEEEQEADDHELTLEEYNEKYNHNGEE